MPLKKFIRSLSSVSSSSTSSKPKSKPKSKSRPNSNTSQQKKREKEEEEDKSSGTTTGKTNDGHDGHDEDDGHDTTAQNNTTTAASTTASSASVWGNIYQHSIFLIPAEAPGSHSYNATTTTNNNNNSVEEAERAIAISSATTTATTTAAAAAKKTGSMCMSTTAATTTTTTTVDPTFERCREILEYYSVKAQQPDQADACKIIDEYITVTTAAAADTGHEGEEEEEDQPLLESAAESSYAYWYYKKHCCTSSSREEDDEEGQEVAANRRRRLLRKYRRAAAVREANRHLEGETFEDAIVLLKETIEFHSNNKTASYRELASSKNKDGSAAAAAGGSSSSSSSSCSPERRMMIEDELCNWHKFCVRGHDREDRAVIFAYPRKKASQSNNERDDVKPFVETIVYTMSRAVACSEFTSGGHQEKIVCVIDAQGSSAPSMKACKEGVQALQKNFPGRLKNLIFLNPPFFLMTLYNMIKPFLDPLTKAKFIIVKSDKAKIAAISKLVDVSQAMPTMLPGGTLTSEVDARTYLYDVPFHRLYDDRTENRPSPPAPAQQAKDEREGFDHSTATTETNATSTTTATNNPYFVVDGEGADDSYSNNVMRSPLVKKPSFIKSIAVGEIRNPDLAATGDDGGVEGPEEGIVTTTVVDAVRS